jgi:hypothetical protein
MLRDAKAEVIAKIESICGYQVREEELSPELRESIQSMAQTFKQLAVIRDLLIVERKDSERLGSRLRRKITGETDRKIGDYMEQLNRLHQTLDQQIKVVATQVEQYIGRGRGLEAVEGAGMAPTKIIIEQLKCKNCGAPLKLPSAFVAKCDYCGANYELSEYLDRLGENIEGKKPEQPSSS